MNMPVTSKELAPAADAKAAEMMDKTVRDATALLDMPETLRTRINELLETALANAFMQGALWHKRALGATNEDAS